MRQIRSWNFKQRLSALSIKASTITTTVTCAIFFSAVCWPSEPHPPCLLLFSVTAALALSSETSLYGPPFFQQRACAECNRERNGEFPSPLAYLLLLLLLTSSEDSQRERRALSGQRNAVDRAYRVGALRARGRRKAGQENL